MKGPYLGPVIPTLEPSASEHDVRGSSGAAGNAAHDGVPQLQRVQDSGFAA